MVATVNKWTTNQEDWSGNTHKDMLIISQQSGGQNGVDDTFLNAAYGNPEGAFKGHMKFDFTTPFDISQLSTLSFDIKVTAMSSAGANTIRLKMVSDTNEVEFDVATEASGTWQQVSLILSDLELDLTSVKTLELFPNWDGDHNEANFDLDNITLAP